MLLLQVQDWEESLVLPEAAFLNTALHMQMDSFFSVV